MDSCLWTSSGYTFTTNCTPRFPQCKCWLFHSASALASMLPLPCSNKMTALTPQRIISTGNTHTPTHIIEMCLERPHTPLFHYSIIDLLIKPVCTQTSPLSWPKRSLSIAMCALSIMVSYVRLTGARLSGLHTQPGAIQAWKGHPRWALVVGDIHY